MGIFDRFFNRPLTRDAFANLIIKGIRKAGEKGPIVYDQDQYRLHCPTEKGTRQFLANSYQEYVAASKADRSKVVQRVVRSWFLGNRAIPEDFEDAKHDLLPVVRSRCYVEFTELLMQIEGHPLPNCPYVPLGDHLAVSLVYDLPEAMRTINQEDIDGWGLTFFEALEVARENLAQMPYSLMGPKEGEGVYLSVTRDNYDASRLLLIDSIRALCLKGAPVAMVPNRDTLILTGADDLEGLKGMLAIAKDALEKPRPISGAAVRLDGDTWVPWLPGAPHPLHGDFRMLLLQSAAGEYGEQKDLLDRLHEKTGQDIFVASFSGYEIEGQPISFCSWTKDVDSLLPRSDRIGLMDPEKEEPVIAAWEDVEAVVGEMMQPVDMYPPRYRVRAFPAEEQLEHIRSRRGTG